MQEKLEKLLHELDQATKQRSQQSAALKKLEQQNQCNWELIQSYEVCEKLHGNVAEDYLNCTQKAKQRATECMK